MKKSILKGKRIPIAIESHLKPFDTIKELRANTLNYCKLNLSGRIIKNKNSGFNIELSWQGLKNDVSEKHQPYIEKLLSFTVIDKIIQDSIFIETVPHKKGNKTIIVHKFLGGVLVRGTVFDVFIYVFETNKKYIYDHGLLIK